MCIQRLSCSACEGVVRCNPTADSILIQMPQCLPTMVMVYFGQPAADISTRPYFRDIYSTLSIQPKRCILTAMSTLVIRFVSLGYSAAYICDFTCVQLEWESSVLMRKYCCKWFGDVLKICKTSLCLSLIWFQPFLYVGTEHMKPWCWCSYQT